MDIKILKETPPWEWPSDAGQVFAKTALDRDAERGDRLAAVELAGNVCVVNDSLVDVLLSILRDPEEFEELRGQSAIALGPIIELVDTDGFEGPEVPPISQEAFLRLQSDLRSLYEQDGMAVLIRRRILEAAVRAEELWHQAAVQEAWWSDAEEWRLTGAFCMRYVRGFEAEILEALDSSNPAIRYEAMCAAGQWQLQGAWPHVAEAIHSPDTDRLFLLAAIEAAPGIRADETPALLAELVDADDDDVAGAALEAIAMAEGELGDDDDILCGFEDDEEEEEDEDDTGAEGPTDPRRLN
jgi:hypothetical protein